VSATQKPNALEELVMTKNRIFLSIAAISALAFAQGCSSAQEVEVTGEATAAATVTGPISIEFFEVAAADAEADETESLSIKKIELAQAGPFKETIEVEGDAIRIFALADSDKNGACTEGEAWAETEATVKEDGTLAAVTLALAVVACPAVAAPK
jgi:hypothetical protein